MDDVKLPEISYTPTLYQIEQNLVYLVEELENCSTDEERAQREYQLRDLLLAEIQKVDHYGQYLKTLETLEREAKEEIERLKDREHRLARRRERLERYAVLAMTRSGRTKLEGKTSTLSLRHNPPAVEIYDATKVPAEFKTIITDFSIDKRSIRRAIESGQEVVGAYLRDGTVSLIRR
jgi:thioesterase domain-containing protein